MNRIQDISLQLMQFIQNEAPAPTTPQKRPRTKKQPIDSDPADADGKDNESPSKKTNRSPTKKAGAMGPIPATYEEASSEDKMMIRMREIDGKSWVEIRKTLEDIMQARIGASSLQIRYTRMKANFVVFDQDDVCILFFPFLCFLPTQGRWLSWTDSRSFAGEEGYRGKDGGGKVAESRGCYRGENWKQISGFGCPEEVQRSQ